MQLQTCATCHTHLTVRHFMLECPGLATTRLKYFPVATMKELFERVQPRKIIDFSKEILLTHILTLLLSAIYATEWPVMC